MDCIDKLGASIDELKASQNKLVELYVATVAERDRLREVNKELLEALYMALPYVETALEDQGYKPNVVERMVKQIKDAIANAEGRE